ncbi:uncharacterized protein A4U43_C07F20950 [Asparagus officinalis]|uniref:Uncharacterized protein n=1 Tax=Asparagus officinalis TaxID=4686 RepID=A0A5P1EFJ0_ASPOF|nr:uncharacterized protein A4U43_C07F20950 [Asparagus officinalis]
MASEQRDGRSRRREEEGERRSRDGSVTDLEDGQPEHVRRDLLRVRGRQARLDLIMRMVRERERELQGIEEQRTVSEFPHRNRIQALLRGRFLRNGTPPENDRPPSVAARELGQLRQRHPVSGLREAFRFRLENIVRGQANSQAENSTSHEVNTVRNDPVEESNAVAPTSVVPSDDIHGSQLRNENSDNHHIETNVTSELEDNRANDDIDWQESVTQEENWQEGMENERVNWQQSTDAGFSDWRDETGEESDVNWQENIDQDWSGEVPDDEEGDDNHLPGVPEWHENDSHETLENWDEGPSDPPRAQHSIPSRRVNRFIPPDDDNVYSMELRELLSRRSVSNLLSSGFRESLDQLIQSYVQRQVHAPLDWDLQGSLPTPASPEEDLNQQSDGLNQAQQDSAARPPLMPSPPAPPRQPLWHSELHHSNWTRQSMNRSEIEWDVINDLRADMARLQQGMSHMQRMLEACMDMQLELQRSVRQEVSAALHRSPDRQDLAIPKHKVTLVLPYLVRS